MMLSVMSAFVAFNGFPGQDVEDPIGSLLLQERQATVTVPAHPVKAHVLASKRATAAAGHRAAARRLPSPIAGTNPVRQRAGLGQPGRTPSSGPQPAGAPTPASSITPALPGGTGTPSLPDTTLPSGPSVTVPQVSPPPPQSTQLPVDTSGVTGILGAP